MVMIGCTERCAPLVHPKISPCKNYFVCVARLKTKLILFLNGFLNILIYTSTSFSLSRICIYRFNWTCWDYFFFYNKNLLAHE